MSNASRAGNPINPRGVPRGVAKPDVYRRLHVWDQHGLDFIEREDLANRLGYEIPDDGRRPSAQLIAQGLLALKDFYDFMGEEVADRERRVEEALAAGDIDEREHDEFLALIWREEERDRRAFALLLLSTRLGLSPEEVKIMARLEADEDVELPDRLSEEAGQLLRSYRKRWRGGGRGERPPFGRQLGKLANQTPRQRELTIADWRRNVRTRRLRMLATRGLSEAKPLELS